MTSVIPQTPQALAYHGLLDQVEARLVQFGSSIATKGEGLPEVFPLEHTFTPGLYVRTIYMPAGSVLTSKIHKTEHPFMVSKGKLECLMEDGAWVLLEAPHLGITQPGTRRLLRIHEDTIWTTFHANPDDLTDLAEIEEMLIEERENPLLEESA